MAAGRSRVSAIVALFMMIAMITLSTFSITAPGVAAWEKGDFEIFDLHDSLIKIKGEYDENGSKIDFYSVMGVSPSATTQEINKAYRKLSLTIHPDKNPGKDNEALYALVTSINAILKDAESRERYDGHRARGIPKWRGTGYFIARFKPSVTFILTFLLIVISFSQYLAAWAVYYRKRSALNLFKDELLSVEKTPDSLSYTDLRRIFKKAGVTELPASVKKAIRAGVATAEILKYPEVAELHLDINTPDSVEDDEDVLIMKEELATLYPKLTGTLVCQIPIGLYNLVVGLFTTNSGKKLKKKKSNGSTTPWEEVGEDYDIDGEDEVQGLKSSVKAEGRAAVDESNKPFKRGALSDKYKALRQKKKKQLREEAAEAAVEAEEGSTALDGEAGDGLPEPQAAPIRKKLAPGMIKSASGVVMSKAEFIRQRQAAMKK